MAVNSAFSALREIEDIQASGQQYQPSSQNENEAQIINQNKEDKPQNTTPTFPERRVKQNEQSKGHQSARQLVTSWHSFSDSSVHIKSNGSRISSDASGEKSKSCSLKKYIPRANEMAIPNDGASGDQSRQQTVNCSRTDTVGSDSEMQESIKSLTSI